MTARQDAALTREQVEEISSAIRSKAFDDVPCATISPRNLRALCDMALASLAQADAAGQTNAGPSAGKGLERERQYCWKHGFVQHNHQCQELTEEEIKKCALDPELTSEWTNEQWAELCHLALASLSRIGGEGKNVPFTNAQEVALGVLLKDELESYEGPEVPAPGGGEGLIESLKASAASCRQMAEFNRSYTRLMYTKQAELYEQAAARLASLEADAGRLDWLEAHLFDKSWSGTIGDAPMWRMAGPYRHQLTKMRGSDLRAAIDAARAERGKEKA